MTLSYMFTDYSFFNIKLLFGRKTFLKAQLIIHFIPYYSV
ncbi:hypothetical protein EFW57_01427 [Bacillus velezensis]|nr:hypothetical protein EFW57_01427 [Bacillus velezensis]